MTKYLLALLLFFSASAQAEIKTYYLYYSVYYTSVSAACDAARVRVNAASTTGTYAHNGAPYSSNSDNPPTQYTCPMIYTPNNGSGGSHWAEYTQVRKGCYANGVFTLGASCVENNCTHPDGEVMASGAYETTGSTGSSTGCISNCVSLFAGTPPQIQCSFAGGVGSCTYVKTGKYVSTGQNCDGSPNLYPSAPPEQQNCPQCDCMEQGKGYGTVNGATVCTNTPTNTTSESDKSSETKPDGSKVTTTKTHTENPDGTVKTDTTQVTVSPSGSSSTSTSSSTQSKDNFCQTNPKTSICKEAEESTFTGSCDQSFQCEGDAVQCAISLNQHKLDCDNRKTDSTSELGKDLIEQVDDSDNPLSDEESEEISLPSSLTSQNLLPKGGLSDVSMSMGSSSVNLPFSKLNGGLNAVGVIVEIFAYLSGMFIVFGRRD